MDKLIAKSREIFKTKLSCGKSILELTEFDNLTLWWLVNDRFIKKLRIYLAEPPDKIDEIVPDNSYLNNLIRPYLSLFYDMIFKIILLILKLLGFLFKGLEEKKSKKSLLAFVTRNRLRKIKDYKKDRVKMGDYIFDPLIEYGDSSFDFMAIYYLHGFNLINNLKICFQKENKWDKTHIPINYFWSYIANKKQREAQKRLRKNWNKIENDPVLMRLCKFDGMDLYPRIKRLLKFFFLRLIPIGVANIYMGKRFCQTIKPSVILTEYEYGFHRRCYSIIGPRLTNTKTFALQHGNITNNHEGYIYLDDEISKDKSIYRPYCQIPDYTLLYGSFFKNLLIRQSSYPGDSLEVTGQPRYDDLFYISKKSSLKSLRQTYSIPKNQASVVLWTTQSHGLSEAENLKNFENVKKAFSRLKNYTLIIKQHPAESDFYRNWIKKEFDNVDFDVNITPRDADTNELILLSDIMLSKHSTTVIEAIILKKYTVILNFLNQELSTSYVNENISAMATSSQELYDILIKMASGKSNLKEKYPEFIEKFIHANDGRSSERVMDFIGSKI